jgi:hypothetical protein
MKATGFLPLFLIFFTLGCTGSLFDKDTDFDGWTDDFERGAGTDPYIKDTDKDGIWDSKDPNPLVSQETELKRTPRTQSNILLETPSPTTSQSTPTPSGSKMMESTKLIPTATTKEILEGQGTNETIHREFRWKYGFTEFEFEADFYKRFYEFYRERIRPPTIDYSVYVTDPFDDEMIEAVVNELNTHAKKANLNEYETAEYVISFVQSLPYTYDEVTTPYDEYPRYPIETLVDYGGDCEDTSILATSFLKEMGYDVVLIVFPGHIGIGIWGDESVEGNYYLVDGKKYFYLETTGRGWDLGELPEQYDGAKAKIYSLNPIPVLIHEWKGEPSGKYLKMKIKVENVGSKVANNVKVAAGFDAGDNNTWNTEEYTIDYLDIGSYADVTLYLEVPYDEHTRILVGIVDEEGYLLDESQSEWFDT